MQTDKADSIAAELDGWQIDLDTHTLTHSGGLRVRFVADGDGKLHATPLAPLPAMLSAQDLSARVRAARELFLQALLQATPASANAKTSHRPDYPNRDRRARGSAAYPRDRR